MGKEWTQDDTMQILAMCIILFLLYGGVYIAMQWVAPALAECWANFSP